VTQRTACNRSRLEAGTILREAGALPDSSLTIPVNSSHHQAAEVVGDGLRLAAWSPEDGVKEAVEGTSPDQFVLGVQWHPERTCDSEPASRAIFRAFVEPPPTGTGNWQTSSRTSNRWKEKSNHHRDTEAQRRKTISLSFLP